MSELHYDADGEPAKLPAAAEEFRVRRFRKPGERGACEIVHGADGAPLYVAVDTTYNEFRTLVDGVAGRYRLDPVDAGRAVCACAASIIEGNAVAAMAATPSAPFMMSRREKREAITSPMVGLAAGLMPSSCESSARRARVSRSALWELPSSKIIAALQWTFGRHQTSHP